MKANEKRKLRKQKKNISLGDVKSDIGILERMKKKHHKTIRNVFWI